MSEILTFVHNYFSNKLPPVFDDYYTTLAQQHQRNIRNGHKLLYILTYDRDIAASSMKISGTRFWNNLDNNL